MAKIHYLKTWPNYWRLTQLAYKNFDVRKNDRGFEIGDILILQLYNPNSVMDVVLEWGNVTGYGVNKVFFINPEYSFFPSNSEGQVTLYGVGWTEGYEYRIQLISINGSKFITKVTID